MSRLQNSTILNRRGARWSYSASGTCATYSSLIMQYDNGTRIYLSLTRDARVPWAVQAVRRILPAPIPGGSHHQYMRF